MPCGWSASMQLTSQLWATYVLLARLTVAVHMTSWMKEYVSKLAPSNQCHTWLLVESLHVFSLRVK